MRTTWTFHSAGQLIFGRDATGRLGETVGGLNIRRLLLVTDPVLVEKALDYAISGKVRNQDAAIQFAIAMGDDETRDLAWKYIQSHWDKIQTLLTPEMGNILVGSTGGFCSEGARDDVKSFFSAHKVAAADKADKRLGWALPDAASATMATAEGTTVAVAAAITTVSTLRRASRVAVAELPPLPASSGSRAAARSPSSARPRSSQSGPYESVARA